jgi:hypothetical protein
LIRSISPGNVFIVILKKKGVFGTGGILFVGGLLSVSSDRRGERRGRWDIDACKK